MRDEQLLRLPRREMKEIVRAWNASLTANTSHSGSLAADPTDPSSTKGNEDASFEFPLVPASGRTLDTDRHIAIQSDDPVPLSVGQVHALYRTRARLDDDAVARKASDAVRVTREKLAAFHRSSDKKIRVTPEINSAEVNKQDDSALPCDHPTESLAAPIDESLCLDNLPPDQVLTDTAYRDEILGHIRRELTAGKPVRLRSDCATTGGSVLDVKLMMQLLCSHCLLHCVSSQDIVPAADTLCPSVIVLELQPRCSKQHSQGNIDVGFRL